MKLDLTTRQDQNGKKYCIQFNIVGSVNIYELNFIYNQALAIQTPLNVMLIKLLLNCVNLMTLTLDQYRNNFLLN